MLVHNQINHYDTVGKYLNLFITLLQRGISVKQVFVISLNWPTLTRHAKRTDSYYFYL